MLCSHDTLGEKEKEEKERNLEVPVFSQLIHCFVVKVIEVTVLSGLYGTYFFQVHIEKNK